MMVHEIPSPLAQAFWQGAQTGRDRLAIRSIDQEWTHTEFRIATESLAAALAAGGLCPGQRVVIVGGHGLPFILAHTAVLLVGGVAAPVPDSSEIEANAGLLETLRPHWILRASEGLPSSEGSRVAVSPGSLPGPRCHWRWHPVADGSTAAPDLGRPAVILCSSGTTGRPKAIGLTAAQVLRGVELWMDAWGFSPTTAALMFAPLHHVVYHPLVMGTLWRGACVVLPPDLQVRSAARAWQELHPNAVMGTPGFFQSLLHGRRPPPSSPGLTLIHGAAPMPEAQRQALHQAFPGARVFDCYGLTETASAVSVRGPNPTERPAGCVGSPHPEVQVRIVDDAGQPVSAGATGEIQCRGPNVITAYWSGGNGPVAPLTSGWLATGDMGFLTEHNEIVLVGRKDDRINVSGDKIYPSAIEDLLRSLPGVADAAVAGVPDPVRGQCVIAWIVAKNESPPSAVLLRAQLAKKLPPHFVPREIHFRPNLPRSASGKLLRRELIESRASGVPRPKPHE